MSLSAAKTKEMKEFSAEGTYSAHETGKEYIQNFGLSKSWKVTTCKV
jgi:hypothetical protein